MPEPTAAQRPKVTLFDLDYTLLPIDSDHAWGVHTSEMGWTDATEFARRNDAFFTQYKAGTLDIHEYVRFATTAMRVQGASNSVAALADYTGGIVQNHLKPAALDLVRQHRDAGDLIAIVTATNELVTRPIADAFGINELIAVELERDGSGWITGEIKGTPSIRAGKVTRVERWLAARGLALAGVESTFYSDSTSDLPLLERVDHPVATNPDAALRRIAEERGWRVLDLFETNA